MTAEDVLDLYSAIDRLGIRIWIDGGWCVDALLGRQTRPHGDLDIAIEQKHVGRARAFLESRGYREVKRDSAWNFEMADDAGLKVDFHAFVLDGAGHVVDGIKYPDGSLKGTGTIKGTPVRCIAPEFLVRLHLRYEPRKIDGQDLWALHQEFGTPVCTNSVDGGMLLDCIPKLRPKTDRRTAIVAIDGYGGSGKTTLANAISASGKNITTVRTDDFSRPGVSGWDWQRMKVQVLDPLNQDNPAMYQRYDWPSDRLAEWHEVPVGGVLVVEGVSSIRRELGEYWDLSIWVTCPHELRLARGIARDGEGMRDQWENVWIPEEDAYVASERPDERADLVVSCGVYGGKLYENYFRFHRIRSLARLISPGAQGG